MAPPLSLLRSLISLVAISATALAVPHSNKHRHHELAARTTASTNHTIAQLFQWNWDSIAQECQYLSKVGYGYVQVGPAQEHMGGPEWWKDYHIVSYNIVSRRGGMAQYQNMVTQCKAFGVGIIADVVINHMSGYDGPGDGVGGTHWDHYNYNNGKLYDANDFHYCGTTGNDISDWYSVTQVQNCELANLADLRTETEKVRDNIVAYMNTLIDMGVAGFRIDAAKHIPVADLSIIIGRLKKQGLYFTHEVVYEGGEGVTSAMFTPLGEVQEFRFTTLLGKAFARDGNLASLKPITASSWLPSSSATVFVVNQDRERSGQYVTYKWSNNAYLLANVFMLGYNYGTPIVYSSYNFDDNQSSRDQGAPWGNNWGSCYGEGGVNGWLCQHRWKEIAGMVGFANVVGTASGLYQWVQGTSNQIAFARGTSGYKGTLGYVIINNDWQQWTSTFTTGMKDGRYCDVVQGGKNTDGTSCRGPTVTVSGGKLINLTVGSYYALAIHNGTASRLA